MFVQRSLAGLRRGNLVVSPMTQALFAPRPTIASLSLYQRKSFFSTTTPTTPSHNPQLIKNQKGFQEHVRSLSSHIAVTFLVPAAFFFPVPSVQFASNLALAAFIPLHAYKGMKHVIEDYVPRSLHSLCNLLLALVTVVAGLGMVRLAVNGDGLSGAIKNLWNDNNSKREK
eukprot:TRINITY_DN2849_c0_g4_i1.p1 TRINITY_DN2849_c0_g4~~TRINITY_DN2849_c0_g4_i1.p1  ORF type:complete len:171 (+),score=29.41 TRINITY_DN2849_c0_g4_i1:120-632(+)